MEHFRPSFEPMYTCFADGWDGIHIFVCNFRRSIFLMEMNIATGFTEFQRRVAIVY
jgi:hypothetical protein